MLNLPGMLGRVDGKDLTLWRVRMTIASDSTTKLTLLQVDLAFPPKNERKDLTGQNAPVSVGLNEEEDISDYWPVASPPTPKRLHIIVQLPSGERCFSSYINPRSFLRRRGVRDDVDQPSKRPRTQEGKRSRGDGDPAPTDDLLLWLKEVHSKIWNREDRRLELFRTVKVTQAHYVALQSHLNELYPDRDSPDYNGGNCGHKLLSAKLDSLRSPPPSEAQRHVDDNRVDGNYDSEASHEDDQEIKNLFPFTLRFLDLSTLKLEAPPSDRLPLPLLLREEYEIISNLIKKEPRNSRGSVIVSGQPGTGEFLVSLSCLTGSNQPCQYQGKTAYLHLKIIESMIEGRQFLYQSEEGTVYHAAEERVEAVQSWRSEETIVAFIDCDSRNSEPRGFLKRRSVQLIVAASPRGAFQKWTKQLGHGGFITTLVVRLWSYKELLLAGLVLALFSTLD
jgi:hypothetical protein